MSATQLKWLHLTAAVIWGIISIPTVLWWKESVLWVALVSCYANTIAHLAAYDAARAEDS